MATQRYYRIYVSQKRRPGLFPTLYFIDLPSTDKGDDPIVALIEYHDKLTVLRKHTIWTIADTGFQPASQAAPSSAGNLVGLVPGNRIRYELAQTTASVGCIAKRTVVKADDGRLYYLGSDLTIRAFDGTDAKRVSEPIHNYLTSDEKYLGLADGFEDKSCAYLDQKNHIIHFIVPARDVNNGNLLGLPNTALAYNYATGTLSQVEREVLRQGQWSRWTGIWANEVAELDGVFYRATSLPEGFIFSLNDDTVRTDIGDDIGTVDVVSSSTLFTGSSFPSTGASAFVGSPIHFLETSGAISQRNWIIASTADVAGGVTFTLATATSPAVVAGQKFILGHIEAYHRTGWLDAGDPLVTKVWRGVVLTARAIVSTSGTAMMHMIAEFSDNRLDVKQTKTFPVYLSSEFKNVTISFGSVSRFMRLKFTSPPLNTNTTHYAFSVARVDVRFRPLTVRPV